MDVVGKDLRDVAGVLDDTALPASIQGKAKTRGLAMGGRRERGLRDEPQSGPHQRELFHFGKRLRDRLNLPTPEEVVRAVARGDRLALWGGRLASDGSRDSEEESLEQEWGFDRYDARRHPLFPAFGQHLGGHACWGALDAANDYFLQYQSACLRAHTAVLERVKERMQDLTESDAGPLASALLMYA